MTAPPEGLEVDQIEFPAGKVRFYQAGFSGPAVVLLHGGGPDNGLLSWRHTIPILATDHRVYIPDLPGQGGSLPWRGRANQRTFEEVLRWLMDAWELQDATLVGLSMGGSVATGFALRHPQRIRGLVLVASSGLQPRLDNHFLHYVLRRTRFLGAVLAKLVSLHRGFTKSMLTRHLLNGSEAIPDLEALVDEVRAEARNCGSVLSEWANDALDRRSMKVNHLPHVGQLRCPTMFIHGEKDPALPVSVSREAASAIPGSALRILPEAGHWPSREKPVEFNALIREFVNTHR